MLFIFCCRVRFLSSAPYAYASMLMALFFLTGCTSTTTNSQQDIFAIDGLSKNAAQCIRSCETNTTGPDSLDRSKMCACRCHKKFNTGRFRDFCDASGPLRDQNVSNIHDGWMRGF